MIFGWIAGSVFLVDLWIKKMVERDVMKDQKINLIRDKIYITKYHNYGAAFNFMEKRNLWVMVCSLTLTLLCTAVFAVTLTHGGRNGLKTGLALLLGGAYSNTYDRLKRRYVVDYIGIHHRKGGKQDVIYNFSDFCILIGALLMVLSEMRNG